MNSPYPSSWMGCTSRSPVRPGASRNSRGFTAMKQMEIRRVPAAPNRRNRGVNSSAAGSSDAPIRNRARPRWPWSPPRSVTRFTMKLTMGMMAARAKNRLTSVRVKERLLFRMYRIEWGCWPCARGGRASLGKAGYRATAAIISTSRAMWVSSRLSVPKRTACWPHTTQARA